jgi:hypothetical protein
LRQAVLFPQDAQERPMAERNVVIRQAHMLASDQGAGSILDKVGQAVVRNGLAPMGKDFSRFFGSHAKTA